MRRSLASGLALALAAAALVCAAGIPAAQTDTRPPEACEPEKQEIQAAALRAAAEPEECPVDGRNVVDGAAGARLPSPGEGVHVELLTPDGAQELEIRRLPDGAVELDHVGDESEDPATRPAVSARSGAPGQCGDGAYRGSGYRVIEGLRYRVNLGTIPGEVSRLSAVAAVRRAGVNVARTDNECGMGDRVPAFASYQGRTSRFPDHRDGSCAKNDGVSVVAFGEVPSALAVTCTYFDLRPGPDEVTSSDVKMDKVDFRWTTSPNSRSCRARYDVQSVMTHERGHTFGLGHVLPYEHANLTMAPGVGPCQDSEKTLGRGDVLGLDVKYE